jgi:two-component system, cell cycle sensor histidine kinase and response regulator CckA
MNTHLLDRLAEDTACAPARVKDEAPGGSENILFVEDERFVREVACEVLRVAGYQVWSARCGADAVRTFTELCGQVDLLLTDVVLPGKTGLALANELRQHRPDLAILVISGYLQHLASDDFRRNGHCLAKPFSAGSLLRKVRDVLDRKAEGTRERS